MSDLIRLRAWMGSMLVCLGAVMPWAWWGTASSAIADDLGRDLIAEPAGQTPAQVVLRTWDGEPLPEQWPLGRALIVSISESVKGSDPRSVAWEIYPLQVAEQSVQIAPELVVLSTGLQPVAVTLRVAVARGDTVDLQTRTIRFVATGPQPVPTPPAPGPSVPPFDPLDPPRPKVNPETDADLVAALIGSRVNWTDDRRLAADRIAQGFDQIAAQISRDVAGAGDRSWLDPMRIVTATAEANRTALRSDRDAWLDAFNALRDWLDARAEAGRLQTAADYASLWPVIAQAFRQAAQRDTTR